MQNNSAFTGTIPDLTTSVVAADSVISLTFKIAFILIAVMYLIYAVVIVRQVKIMNATVETPLGSLIQVVAWLHLALAVVFGAGVLLFL